MRRTLRNAPGASTRAFATLKRLECEARVSLRGNIVAVYTGDRSSRLSQMLGFGPFRIRWRAVLRSALPRRREKEL